MAVPAPAGLVTIVFKYGPKGGLALVTQISMAALPFLSMKVR
jgi:hypothetical protein